LQIQGSRESGQDVRGQNVTAVAAIANIVKSSLGPVGLDKVCVQETTGIAYSAVSLPCTTHALAAMQMLVDDIGDVTITNDGATILKLLEVEHPAAKVILPSCQPLHPAARLYVHSTSHDRACP